MGGVRKNRKKKQCTRPKCASFPNYVVFLHPYFLFFSLAYWPPTPYPSCSRHGCAVICFWGIKPTVWEWRGILQSRMAWSKVPLLLHGFLLLVLCKPSLQGGKVSPNSFGFFYLIALQVYCSFGNSITLFCCTLLTVDALRLYFAVYVLNVLGSGKRWIIKSKQVELKVLYWMYCYSALLQDDLLCQWNLTQFLFLHDL